MKKYICTVTSNSTHARAYEVTTSSAIKAAQEHGRCEGGETVTIGTISGKIMSRAIWSPEAGGKYIRVTV